MLSAVIVLSEIALRTDRPLVYIVFPSLIWAALRFGPRGGTLAVAVAVGFTLWKTAHHAGPFVVDSIPRSTLSTQLYVSVAALSTMFLAAVVAEREAIAKGLRESRARLVRRCGPRAPPAGEQPPRRRPADADDARRPARHGQRGVATQSRPRARALRGCGDAPPDRHRRAARSGARDPPDDPHRPRPRRGDPQPDRRLAGPDPAARAACGPARFDRRGDRLLRRRRGAHERAAARPCEDDHDPRHRVGALSCGSRSATTAPAARTNEPARASRACATGSRPWAACSEWRARPGRGTLVRADIPLRSKLTQPGQDAPVRN